ncbi:hypothetical protein GDO86_014039 [Hymenochirus boettgeri]|uniref:Transmembrane channel-like protein n=1 Tax=Hymenochirus boettgeri TaxID=247094 RepID=A0A8T2JQ64_9PIPI|nr:hypothetical protein GDO86_014039 [Hymenochirus boettgeri]
MTEEKSVTSDQHPHLKAILEKGQELLTYCILWERTLVGISGKFGSGIASYFLFLRLLILLNLVSLLLTTGLLIVPTISSEDNRQPSGQMCSYVHNSRFDIRLAYLLTPLSFLIVCCLYLLRCTVRGLTLRRVKSRDYRTRISSRVFSAWDFCIQEDESSLVKQQNLSNDIKVVLPRGERWFWDSAGQPFSTRVRVLTIRVLINCMILTLMEQVGPILRLIIQYLVPLVISLVDLILPLIFTLLVRFEGQSPNTEINLTIIRCVFLRLGTLGIFLFSLGQKILCLNKSDTSCNDCGYNANFQCWETSVGQEFYKLSMFHFLEMLMKFLLLQLPMRFLSSRFHCRLIHWLSPKQFRLPQNILDVVYGQTLVWGGLFYAPLLPLLYLIYIFITFYVKRFYLYHACDTPQKLYRESTSRILFHFVLLLGLITILLPLLYMVVSAHPSPSCGLFTNHKTSWEAIQNITQSTLPFAVLSVLDFLSSELCGYVLLLLLR